MAKVKDIDFSFILKDVESVLKSKQFRLAVNNEFAKMCDPYVPMDEGVLAQSVQVLEDGLFYPGPYAHYMYIGQVYGPNIPIIEDGQIVGWWSPPGQQKHPTGKEIHYSTERHPLASKEWDKAMMRDRGDVFMETIENILYWSLKHGNK